MYFFIIGDWNAKVGNWEIPGVVGKFGLRVQYESQQRLTEFCQENALVIANTLFQQYKRWLYTWILPDGQYWNQINYILCSQRWRSSIQSAKARPGLDCDWDHELLIAKVKSLSCVRLFTTPWTVAHQAPTSMEFSRQECWSRLPFPFPGDLPDPGIKPRSPALQAEHIFT